MRVERLARKVKKKSSRALDKMKKAYDARLTDDGGFTSEEDDEDDNDHDSQLTNKRISRRVQPMHAQGQNHAIENDEDDDDEQQEDRDDNEDDDEDDEAYENGAKLRMHEKMEFEKWVREVIYAKRIKQKPMQVVKSRIMHGVTVTLATSCIVFLIGLRADYRYVMSVPMRATTSGARVTDLLYAKASMGLIAGCWALRAWFTRNLLRESVLRVYVFLRCVEWIVTLWLLFALWVDFGALPFQSDTGLASGEKAIYFFSTFICLFGLINTVVHFSRLRREWHEYEDRALRAYLDAKEAAKWRKRPARGFDPQELLAFNSTEVVPHSTYWANGDATLAHAEAEAFVQTAVSAGAGGGREDEVELFVGDGFIDKFAIMSLEEFMLRWDSMAESGDFDRDISYVPSVQEMDLHLSQRGFHLVYSDEQDVEVGPAVRMFAFAQSQGAVFLIEFLFDITNRLLHASFRSQDDSKTPNFVSQKKQLDASSVIRDPPALCNRDKILGICHVLYGGVVPANFVSAQLGQVTNHLRARSTFYAKINATISLEVANALGKSQPKLRNYFTIRFAAKNGRNRQKSHMGTNVPGFADVPHAPGAMAETARARGGIGGGPDDAGSLEHMMETCVQTLKNLSAYDLAARLAVNDRKVQEAVDMIDKIAEAMERLEQDYLEEKNRSPVESQREYAPIGQVVRILMDADEWTSILTACLSWESASMRPNLTIKLAAMRMLVAFLAATDNDGFYYEVFLLERIVPYQELLAYAYGDAYLSTVSSAEISAASTSSSAATPNARRRRRAPRAPARVEDEMAKQVIRWWKERPSEARILRLRATALLRAWVEDDRVAADYIVEPHGDRGMLSPFPRVLLTRLRTELIDAYEHGTRRLAGHRIARRGCAEIKKFHNFNAEIRHVCRLFVVLSDANAAVIRPVLQEDGVGMLLRLLKIDREDAALQWDVVDLLTALMVFRKFANEFIDAGGVSLLFNLAKGTSVPGFMIPVVTNCFTNLAATGMGKICQTQKPLVEPLNAFMLEQVSNPQAREGALGYFRDALKCPVNLRIFDNLKGVYEVLNALSDVYDQNFVDGAFDIAKQEGLIAASLGALESYFRMHVAIAAHIARFDLVSHRNKQQGANSISNKANSHVHHHHHHHHQGRPRSSSIGSRSSMGSAGSHGFHRARELPEDKPVEIDDVAHANDMSFLQSNMDAVMRLLARSSWPPVETLLRYELPVRSTTTRSRENSNEGISAAARARRGSTSAEQDGGAETAPAENQDGDNEEPLAKQGQAHDNSHASDDAMHSQTLASYSNATATTGGAGAGLPANRKHALLLLLDVVRSGLVTSIKALQILRIITLVPSTYKMVCEASLPNQHPLTIPLNSTELQTLEDESVLGISVLLEAMATFEAREAEVLVAALEVLCNCCTPAYGDDRAQRPVRRLARDNNALMTLLALLRYDETPKLADQIRYLACLVLQGLAKDHHVAQVLETLNLSQALTKIARTEPVLVENKKIHKRLKREALKLIEHISGTDIGDVADATNKRLLRNSIVDRTQISFDSRELLGLIEGHLRDHGYGRVADVLESELQSRYKENSAKGSSPRFSWPTKYLGVAKAKKEKESSKGAVMLTPPRRSSKSKERGDSDAQDEKESLGLEGTAGHDGDPSKKDGKLVVGKKRRFGFVGQGSMQKRRKVSSKVAATPVKTESCIARQQVSKVMHSNSGNSTALERIVQDYLREQHRKCLEPVTIIPPMSLHGDRHECTADKKHATGAPINVTQRLFQRETTGSPGNSGCLAQNARFVHGRSKWVKTFRNITRNEDTDPGADMNNPEFSQMYTCVSFLQPLRAGYEDLLLGTSGGDLVMRNTHTCQTYAKWAVHESPLTSVNVVGDRVLTHAESGNVALSKFPASVVEAYADDEDRVYAYAQRNRNGPDDELVQLWQHENVMNVEMDQACVRMVATTSIERGRHEQAAIVYDLQTGRFVSRLSHVKLSSRYQWHRACFAPHDSNLVLHDGLLWDVRAHRHIHKFDKFTEYGRATFRPDGTHVAIDTAVWDMRTFKLFVMCEAFAGAVVKFDSTSSVAYSYYPPLFEEKQMSVFTVTDASDYSNITTQDLQPHRIVDLALDTTARKLAVLTERSLNHEEDRSKICTCRLYEAGRTQIADDDEYKDDDELLDDEDDEDDENDMDSDDDIDDDDDDDDEDEDEHEHEHDDDDMANHPDDMDDYDDEDDDDIDGSFVRDMIEPFGSLEAMMYGHL
ncbi:DDB1- and CUL4-associated factor 1 [Hondaea fermentalgiana]|uniref:DDB1-and CUL4-associated factor 1 n=1 Tax=Hondaea fermentalgiana TaxID=2315210 RepID=A0A2R5GHH7_9STRA|nr:DDB1- and CUL4-associated factor 1 [Hondaea fermentalgiana]|eukprot:GBG30045.1 DDB1- and CUL4-associated factor 1 [Hondaea fermentalgiana]